jgi:HAD superfamily hydrolase (TIGR01484 family)
MKPLSDFPLAARRRVRHVLMDLDDTLTDDGTLSAAAFAALEALHRAGFTAVPVTGRPAGWCDHMARMWPVDAVVGENGAFYFRYDRRARRMTRRFWRGEEERRRDRERLQALAPAILAAVPGARVAADQAFREADLAIDWREDVPPLASEAVDRIVALFEGAGARAKVSSIHVNGWFGDFDKLAMARVLMGEAFGVDLDRKRASFVFVGDSPNDAPLFGHFPNSIGVANVQAFLDRLRPPPAFVTQAPGGRGFAEVAGVLIAAREGVR